MSHAYLKRRYKENPPAAGVFVIRNGRNGKTLVGRSTNAQGILNRHRFNLKMRSHENRQLQADWNEAGEDAFSFEIVETIDPRDEAVVDLDEELRVLEYLWLEKLQPYDDRGYNTRPKTG